MTQKNTKKDEKTEQLRQMIQQKIVSIVEETSDADDWLCTLSYQSKIFPEKRIWVDTNLKGSIGVDLEDVETGSEWDSAIARVKVDTLEDALELIQTWLSGQDMDKYTNLNKEYDKVIKVM